MTDLKNSSKLTERISPSSYKAESGDDLSQLISDGYFKVGVDSLKKLQGRVSDFVGKTLRTSKKFIPESKLWRLGLAGASFVAATLGVGCSVKEIDPANKIPDVKKWPTEQEKPEQEGDRLDEFLDWQGVQNIKKAVDGYNSQPEETGMPDEVVVKMPPKPAEKELPPKVEKISDKFGPFTKMQMSDGETYWVTDYKLVKKRYQATAVFCRKAFGNYAWQYLEDMSGNPVVNPKKDLQWDRLYCQKVPDSDFQKIKTQLDASFLSEKDKDNGIEIIGTERGQILVEDLALEEEQDTWSELPVEDIVDDVPDNTDNTNFVFSPLVEEDNQTSWVTDFKIFDAGESSLADFCWDNFGNHFWQFLEDEDGNKPDLSSEKGTYRQKLPDVMYQNYADLHQKQDLEQKNSNDNQSVDFSNDNSENKAEVLGAAELNGKMFVEVQIAKGTFFVSQQGGTAYMNNMAAIDFTRNFFNNPLSQFLIDFDDKATLEDPTKFLRIGGLYYQIIPASYFNALRAEKELITLTNVVADDLMASTSSTTSLDTDSSADSIDIPSEAEPVEAIEAGEEGERKKTEDKVTADSDKESISVGSSSGAEKQVPEEGQPSTGSEEEESNGSTWTTAKNPATWSLPSNPTGFPAATSSATSLDLETGLGLKANDNLGAIDQGEIPIPAAWVQISTGLAEKLDRDLALDKYMLEQWLDKEIILTLNVAQDKQRLTRLVEPFHSQLVEELDALKSAYLDKFGQGKISDLLKMFNKVTTETRVGILRIQYSTLTGEQLIQEVPEAFYLLKGVNYGAKIKRFAKTKKWGRKVVEEFRRVVLRGKKIGQAMGISKGSPRDIEDPLGLYGQLIDQYSAEIAKKYGISFEELREYVKKTLWIESGFDNLALSLTGCPGLLQHQSDRSIGDFDGFVFNNWSAPVGSLDDLIAHTDVLDKIINPYNAKESLYSGIDGLAKAYKLFGRWDKAIGSHNAGVYGTQQDFSSDSRSRRYYQAVETHWLRFLKKFWKKYGDKYVDSYEKEELDIAA